MRGENAGNEALARANLQIVETSIPGVVAIEPVIFGDGRGFFMEVFNADRYAAAVPEPFPDILRGALVREARDRAITMKGIAEMLR